MYHSLRVTRSRTKQVRLPRVRQERGNEYLYEQNRKHLLLYYELA